MLTTGEAITSALRFYANVGSESVEHDQNVRDRGHFHLNQIAKQAWLGAPWWWRHGDGTVTNVESSGSMPADFGHLGMHGQVYISGTTRRPLTFSEPGPLYAMRAASSSTTTHPSYYTLSGKTAVGLSQIQVYPTASPAVTLLVKQYVRKMPTLVDRPGRLTAADGGQDGSLTGAYRYKVTFVTAEGETEPGPASVSVTVGSNRKMALSAIPVSASRAVTSRKVYRTVASGLEYKLLTTIADNVTTTYTDNTADGSLGAAAPTPSTAVTGLEVFPDDMIEPLLVEWLIAKLKDSAGDLRAKKDIESCELNVKRYWGEFKQGQNANQSLPAFGAGSYASPVRSWRDRLQGA